MKKIITLFVANLFALCGYAQIYTKILHFDKFDDVIKQENRKTLITKTDTTFVVEEKGKAPVAYYILHESEVGTLGSKDDIVNLTGNVYGYQESWCVVRYDQIEQYRKVYLEWLLDRSDENTSKLTSYWLFATLRTVTTQYTGSYINRIFWLKDEDNNDLLGKGVNRIIYTEE